MFGKDSSSKTSASKESALHSTTTVIPRGGMVQNSGKENHYVLRAVDVFNNEVRGFVAEVSGENFEVPLISIYNSLSNATLKNLGLDPKETRAKYKSIEGEIADFERRGEREHVQKLKAEYYEKGKKVTVDFGLEKLRCVSEFLNDPEKFGVSKRIGIFNTEGTLERLKKYSVKPFS